MSAPVKMTSGSPYRLMLGFALPLLLGNFFQQLYNMVDSIVVGQFVGTKALAGVGAGFPFLMIFVSLFLGIGMAGTILIAQFYGADDMEALRRTASTIYKVFLPACIPVTIIGILFARPVLILMNVPNDGTLDMAQQYLQIIFAGLIASMGYNLNAGLLQGLGNSKAPMFFLIVSTAVNIVLDIIFVLPLHMGVRGAALATVIAQLLSWILGLRFINRHYPFMALHFRHLPFDRGIFRRAVSLGIPSGLQNMLFSIGMMVLTALINKFGSAFIAGFTGANKIDSLVFLPIMSLSNAVTAYTGQNVGAKQLDRVKQGLRAGLVLGLGAAVFFSALLYPLSEFSMRLFTQDPDAIRAGALYLHQVLPVYFLLAALFVYNSVLRGAGQMIVPLICSLIGLWFARVPAAYWLAAAYGERYLFFSYGIGWLIGLIFVLIYYYSGRWHHLIGTPSALGGKAENS